MAQQRHQKRADDAFYANQLLRLLHAEQQVADFVDRLSDDVSHPELQQVLDKEQRLLEQEQQTIKRIYEKLDVEGEAQSAESFVEATRKAEQMADDLRDLESNARDLEIIALFQQLKAHEAGTLRSLLMQAEEMDRTEDVREFQSMLQRENRMDEKLTNVARNNLHRGGDGKAGEPRPPGQAR